MSDEAREGFELHPEIENAISLFFKMRTAFFFEYSRGFVNPFGTGIFAVVDGKPYVLSSYHVWEQGKSYGDIKIAAFHLLAPEGGDLKKIWWTPKESELIPLKTVNGIDVDLMAIRLDAGILKMHPDIFIEENLIDCGHTGSVDLHYQVAGFPTVLFKPSPENTLANPNKTTLVIYGTDLKSIEDWSSEYNPEYHYILNYPEEMALNKKANISAPDPGGMSGGGIWTVIETGTEIWSAHKKVRLVGIQYAWRRNSRVMVGSHVKYLVEEIKKVQ